MGRREEFGGSARPCPECGTQGKPDGGMSSALSHCATPGHCHVYTWSPQGEVMARDVHTKGERDQRADAFDAKLRALNPFIKR